MPSTLIILLPIFALIGAGFVCRRTGVMGPAAAGELNRFVVRLALPALMFDILATTSWQQLWQPAFVATFFAAGLIVFFGVLAQRLLSGSALADASVDAIAASYPNTGYMGFPLMLLVFGQDGLLPTSIVSIIVICVLFALAVILIEAGLQTERRPHRLLLKVGGSLARNPLIVAPLAGATVSLLGLSIPASGQTFLKLLGGAASPCALVSLGLFLAGKRQSVAANRPTNGITPAVHAPSAGDATSASQAHTATVSSVAAIATAASASSASSYRLPIFLTVCKLLALPALTWWLGGYVFGLPLRTTHMLVLLAALPTGTGPYMLAEFYQRDALVTSRTIMLSTALSILTLSVLMLFMK